MFFYLFHSYTSLIQPQPLHYLNSLNRNNIDIVRTFDYNVPENKFIYNYTVPLSEQ